MKLLETARRQWQARMGEEETPFDGDTPAWVVSLLVHVAVLLSLALTGLAERPEPVRNFTVIEAPPEVEEEVVLESQEFAVSEDPREQIGADSEQGDEAAQAVAPIFAPVSVVSVEVQDDLVSDVTLPPVDEIPTAEVSDAAVVRKGARGVGATGATGAVDHLTAEIEASLARGPTVVCWVFDRSVSLSAQRNQIADRMSRVFHQLGAMRAAANRPDLENMVVAFGESVGLVTKNPTDDVDEVVKAIRSISVDDSGVEMTFLAIRKTAEVAKKFRQGAGGRNVMIVVFTDEVGNDASTVDETAKLCRKLGFPVYVVGVPAPFGMAKVQMKYVEFDPMYSQGEQWVEIEQGPETLYPEVVRVRSGRLADDAIDSGFGPYALSRLCAETGGIYFRVHANSGARGRVTNEDTAPLSSRLRYFFDPEVMRHYQPDYASPEKVAKEINANRAKRALFTAAGMYEVPQMVLPETTFPRKSDGEFVALLGEAQKTAASLQPKIDTLYETLRAGLPDRERLREKRWQAGYDLALGRVLAAKVRTDAYNKTLAKAKFGMKFQNPKSDTWVLEPSDDVAVDAALGKLATQANELLEGVLRQHAGTPWALLAAEELRIPLGYQWVEATTGVNDPPAMNRNGNNNMPAPPPDDQRRMLAPPKPSRDFKKL
ncbi:MAG: vWA domain-containing protein [Planctomycetia bacterium]|jgi:hypothetical protein